MSHLFGKRKKQNSAENSGRTWKGVEDTRWIKFRSGTMKELRKQSRDEVPAFPVYPFTMLKQDNVEIPYTACVAEIIPYLKKDMSHFKCGVIALVWKGSRESYEALCNEFKNSDYYRRKLVVEYLVYHDMFPMNGRVLGEAVLDGHELVVKTALEKVFQHNIFGLKKEILIAMECWPDHTEIQKLCKNILNKYEVRYKRVVDKQQMGEEVRKQNILIFQGNFTMYFGKYQPSHVKGWHIMNITDVATDGTVTVVSWGRTYTMQLKDMRPNYHFVHITYPTV